MDNRLEWFGFSVARKHVYFYSLLILTSIFANSIRGPVDESSEADPTSAKLRQLAEQVASADSNPRY